jgi:hypothetical protein
VLACMVHYDHCQTHGVPCITFALTQVSSSLYACRTHMMPPTEGVRVSKIYSFI